MLGADSLSEYLLTLNSKISYPTCFPTSMHLLLVLGVMVVLWNGLVKPPKVSWNMENDHS